ncbi:MAG TPA: hypothetical protein V6D09_19520 [Leptolyngbyaceae cyanobacterium]
MPPVSLQLNVTGGTGAAVDDYSGISWGGTNSIENLSGMGRRRSIRRNSRKLHLGLVGVFWRNEF